MARAGWLRRHRVLAAFLAGVLLTLAGLAAAGYYVLSDQRRAGRLLARALSQALAREVRIAGVSDLGTERLVLRGVELPREGGWPATVVAERVEASGPLLAAARGDPAPLRVAVSGSRVELPPGAGEGGLAAALDGLRESLQRLLATPVQLDVRLSGGLPRPGGGQTEFELVLVTDRGTARGELTLRDDRAPPLALRLDGRLEGDTARVTVTGRGALAPLGGWLGDAGAAIGERPLELEAELQAGPAAALAARGRIALGEVALKGGVLDVAFPRATVDLDLAAALAGLAWRPTGRAELGEVTVTWPRGAGTRPTVRGTVRLAALGLPAAALGTEVAAERIDARVVLEPAGGGLALTGDARVARLRAAGFEASSAETRYRVAFGPSGEVARIDLEGFQGRVEGAALRGTLGYEAGGRRLEARLEGDDVEVASLVRRLRPGGLGAADRLRLGGLRLAVADLDPGLGRGAVRLEAQSARLARPDGQLTTGPLAVRADLGPASVALGVDGERLRSTLPAVPGELARLSASAELARDAEAGLRLARGALTARDREGRELLGATLAPAPAAGRLRLAASIPALDRLGGLWPGTPRRLTGSARFDGEVSVADPTALDGRLVLTVPEAELGDGRVSVRDLDVQVPVRRGSPAAGEPPWGTVAVGELIAYGVVARDLTTPARIRDDRLRLDALAFDLYAGRGTGWSEVALGPDGLVARGQLAGDGVRIEQFVSAYGIRGGTMTGLLRYEVSFDYQPGRLGLTGRFVVPEGGTVNIELLNRLLGHAGSDPTGVLRAALENLRAFDYKHAEATVRSAGGDVRVSLSLRGRERFLIFPPRVREINIRNMPLSFLAVQFPGL
jgi:hypothetical protein